MSLSHRITRLLEILTASFRDGPKDQPTAIRDAEIAIEKEPARRHDSQDLIELR